MAAANQRKATVDATDAESVTLARPRRIYANRPFSVPSGSPHYGLLRRDADTDGMVARTLKGTTQATPFALDMDGLRRYRLTKRFLDVLISLAFMVLIASWLFPIIGIAIKFTSKGPVFFRQARFGKDGVAFVCLKFRTMTHCQPDTFLQAKKDDCRINPVGRFLRRTSLDELPQFINVLLGEMAIIGPRPHAVEHDEEFRAFVPNFSSRYLIKPGITGLAQIMGHRGETKSICEMKRRIRLDLVYIRKVGFPLDVKIFFGTISCLLRGDPNAY